MLVFSFILCYTSIRQVFCGNVRQEAQSEEMIVYEAAGLRT